MKPLCRTIAGKRAKNKNKIIQENQAVKEEKGKVRPIPSLDKRGKQSLWVRTCAKHNAKHILYRPKPGGNLTSIDTILPPVLVTSPERKTQPSRRLL